MKPFCRVEAIAEAEDVAALLRCASEKLDRLIGRLEVPPELEALDEASLRINPPALLAAALEVRADVEQAHDELHEAATLLWADQAA